MFARATKEELAILLPNTMSEHLQQDAAPMPVPAGERSAVAAGLSAMLRRVAEWLVPSAVNG